MCILSFFSMDSRLKVSVLSVTVSIILLGSLIPAQAFTTGFVIDFETFQHGEVINTQMQAQITNGPTGLGVTIFGDNYWLPIPVPEYTSDTNDPTAAAVFPTLGNIDTFDLAVAFDSDPADPFDVEEMIKISETDVRKTHLPCVKILHQWIH